MRRLPTHPLHPERVCWGCDEYCPAHDLTCGKDTVRTPHPLELFGDDWDRAADTEVESEEDATRARVVEALRGVFDPETAENIVDSGVLHDVQVEGARIRVTLAQRSSSQLLAAALEQDVARRIRILKGVSEVQVVRLRAASGRVVESSVGVG